MRMWAPCSEGGPGLADCAALIRQTSTQPAVDLRRLLEWLFFNLYVGNNDSHAKNLSMLEAPGGGQTLAPFYDLMGTRIYPGLSREFAFSVGGEAAPGSMRREHLDRLADELEMQAGYLRRIAGEVIGRVPRAVERAGEQLVPLLSSGARTLVARLERFVVSNAEAMGRRIGR